MVVHVNVNVAGDGVGLWGACACAWLVGPVPREAVEDLYEQWNDVAEGFGVDKDESREIFSVLQETLDMAKKPLASISDLLFDVYDTDNVREACEEARVARDVLCLGVVHLLPRLSFACCVTKGCPHPLLCVHSRLRTS